MCGWRGCIQIYSWKEHRLLMNVKLGKKWIILFYDLNFLIKKLKYPSLGYTRAQWPEMNSASCKTGARLQWKMNSLSIMDPYYSSSKPGTDLRRQPKLTPGSLRPKLPAWCLIDWNRIGRNTHLVKTYLVCLVTRIRIFNCSPVT